ncbi:phosphotransferase enzyme family protein [Aspergillus homomorphus CBS 101889]|uniref:Phosphotransferase enzyme family protein n=1 Tax=Aspergillus homomorphus (strain CBS 101889) TaxID=1450537 RepID=A0A395HWF3_ASPHC|nr:phosphotransferase enzyme family protein [Aspergillus homomorphus CBS 101889]RAL11755.1 phosphotransferase enzyme family protein [Aspergillus homomorphus CBS 101889]
MGSRSCDNHLVEYTSGRFLCALRLHPLRRIKVEALAQAVCHPARRTVSDLPSITKFAEGGFNRVLQATFADGYTILARIPYNSTVPEGVAVPIEAATLGLLRPCHIPVPRVLGYSQDHKNAVGTAYLLLEKLEGIPLSDQWFGMDNKNRVKIMNGSFYYRKDLDLSQHAIPISGQPVVPSSDQIVIDPTAQHQWWYKERALLDIDRGPWDSFSACFEVPAQHEAKFCRQSGKPRLHVERYLRELHNFQLPKPENHIRLLAQYLKLAPYLVLPSSHRLSRPVLRHPDLTLNNILLDSSNNIIGNIDWQHAALNQSEQESIRETRRTRIVHFYYAALTLRQMPDHSNIFNRAGAPWEGDPLSLEYVIHKVYKHWPMSLVDEDATSSVTPRGCPIGFTEDEIQRCEYDHGKEEGKIQELREMRDLIGTDSLGCIPHEQSERSLEVLNAIKAGLMEECNTETERLALHRYFPFEDHEEDE